MSKKCSIDLYRGHIVTVNKYLLNMCHHPELAEDLTQQTFNHATIYFDKQKDECVQGWLLRTARNIYIDWWRRKRNSFKYSLETSNFELAERLKQSIRPHRAEKLIRQEQKLEFRKVMLTLPEAYRTALVLRDILGLSYDEIGKVTHWSTPEVKAKLYQARQEFRKLYVMLNNQ